MTSHGLASDARAVYTTLPLSASSDTLTEFGKFSRTGAALAVSTIVTVRSSLITNVPSDREMLSSYTGVV